MTDHDRPVVSRSRSPRALLVVVVFAALLAGMAAGCAKKVAPAPPETPKESSPSVNLSKEAVQRGGIRVEAVSRIIVPERVAITGELRSPAQNTAVITSRVAGKVLRLLVREGQEVVAGASVAVIDSVELAKADAEFHAARSRLEAAQKNLVRVQDLARLGYYSRGTLEAERNSLAEARTAWKNAQASLNLATSTWRRANELNAEGIVAQRDLEAARAELLKARAAEEGARASLSLAQSRLQREELIFRKGLRSLQEIHLAEKDCQNARVDFEAAQQAVAILGVTEATHGRMVTVTTPISGVVASVAITQGQAVEAVTELMKVVDPRHLWLIAQVYEKDLPTVKVGQWVRFSVKAWPQERFQGRIVDISQELDESTRTAKARISFDNPLRRLKAGMFVEGSIQTRSGAPAIMIPREAVQRADEKDVVYVEQGEGKFVPRPVRLGRSVDEQREVLEGLSPGERIVTVGAFSLKSEQLKSSVEEGG